MPRPSVQTYLRLPGNAWVDVSSVVDISSSYEITDAIEAPSETNTFVAPDVQVKIHAGDPSRGEFQLSWLDGILPESTDFYVKLVANGVTVFSGFILPTTLQIDDAERWATFTAVGTGAKLARWSAENSSLVRLVDPWYIVSSAGNAWRASLVIQRAFPQYLCEFLTDDVVAVDLGGGNSAEVKVVSTAPIGTSMPAQTWTLIVEGMDQPFAAGAAVTLVTTFVRNITLQNMVNALFFAAGLTPPVGSNYGVSPISGASAQFASKPNLTGLAGLPLTLSATVDPDAFELPVVGTTFGTYVQTNPPLGSWIQDGNYLQGVASNPVDWTDGTANTLFSSMNRLLYGQREEGYPQSLVDPDSAQVYIKWRYWITSSVMTPPFIRFGIAITVSNPNATLGDFAFMVDLYRETSNDGFAWTRTHTVSVPGGSTTTNLHSEVWATCDIDVTGTRSSQSRVIFTYPVGGDPCDYAVGHASVTDLSGLATEVLTGARGQFQSGCLFETDGLRGSQPVARPYLVNESGVPVTWQTPIPIPRGFAAHTFTMNRGDNYWYALAGTETGGVILLSFASNRCAPRPGWNPPQIEPPGTPLYSSLDLVAVRAYTYSGPWPMIAKVGTNLWWIAYSFAGVIPYADIEGLSCGEALAQLATIVDGTFFVNPLDESHFLSRSITNGKTIATGTASVSTRIDDAGCITIRRASVFFKSYRYAKVINERDDTIVGEAGDKNFVGTEQALEISNRFVTTVSMARALAEHVLSYLGRALQALEVVHELDGRNYSIGRSCTAVRAGVFRTYQIIESTPRPIEGTVRVLALEL